MIHLIILTIQAKAPKVRSDIQEYLEQGKNNLQRLELQYFSSPIKDTNRFRNYGRNVCRLWREILYRPFDKFYHLGLSLHSKTKRF